MRVDFIDSNVLTYLFDQTDPRRRGIAREIVERSIADGTGSISFQVVQEVLNVTTHKMENPLSGTDAVAFFDTILSPLWRVYPSGDLYRRAVQIKVRYRFGFYDSLIVAGALEGGCTRLLSEDLQDGQAIDSLTVENPFR
jgi:predicted nucleic acid-binding protein